MLSGDPHGSCTVREADPDELVPVVRLLEGALLDVAVERVRERVAAGETLVAVGDGHVRGALVLDGDHVVAVAVRPAWRGRGLGRALVEAANARADRLTADFDPDVREFYEALGFEIDRRDGRLWGVRE